MSTGVRKRARTEPEDEDVNRRVEPSGGCRNTDSQVTETQKDSEFWYEDGNVILLARDVKFRVYKGILADHSPVFKDMFSLPQPPGSVESCPTVRITDSPEDLRHVLRVYIRGTSCLNSGDPSIYADGRWLYSPFLLEDPSFAMVSALIRLGHKYEMTKSVDHCITHLPRTVLHGLQDLAHTRNTSAKVLRSSARDRRSQPRSSHRRTQPPSSCAPGVLPARVCDRRRLQARGWRARAVIHGGHRATLRGRASPDSGLLLLCVPGVSSDPLHILPGSGIVLGGAAGLDLQAQAEGVRHLPESS